MSNIIRIFLALILVNLWLPAAFCKISVQSDIVGDTLAGTAIVPERFHQKKVTTVSQNSLANRFDGGLKLNPDQNRLLEIIDGQIESLQPLVDNEMSMMMNVVQPISRSDAASWLASFISNKPLSCPLKKQGEWIESIINGVENNQLPLSKEILALVSCIISMESGFRSDPLAVDPSRGEDMSTILDRAERDLAEKFGSLLSVPPVPHFYQLYKEKFFPMILACKTEGDVELAAKRIVEDLKKDIAFLPNFMKTIVEKELYKVKHIVRTKGSMQLNFPRAVQIVRERGESLSEDQLMDYMYTMQGGVDVGIAALKPMFVQYAARYGAPGDKSWLFFVGMDYHYGPFSSRNMMEQIRIKDLSGRDISIDGDFLHYDDTGFPANKESDTFKAAASLLPNSARTELYQNFLLEKHPHYIYSNTHQRITAAHQARFGPTPFAIIGDLWMGESAQIKHGATWKTHNYLNKLDKLLNSIPWDYAY